MRSGLVFAAEWAAVLSLVEGIGGLAVLAGVAGWLCCHQKGCYRLGRFRHGQYRLCHVHHPLVPTSGNIGAADIKRADDCAP